MAASQGIYDNPPTWIPYISNRDCSQGICSLNCPQFCYFVLPPPPPVDFAGEVNSSPFNFSPLVIAIIGILASAILLVSYYTLISKYCRSSSQPRADVGGVSRVSGGLSGRERWFFGPNAGLEESVIQSIAVVKYKKGVGSIAATSCSVCLSEFEDGETVRLLPKCTHPFHVPCIDTWLRSHPSCPLCRSDIVFPMLPPPEKETAPSTSSSPAAVEGAVAEGSGERSNDDVIIEVGEEGLRPMRRSFSTGHWCQTVADVMREDDGDDVADRPGDSKTAEICKSGHREIRVLDSGKSAMKRSFSSGRLTISRLGRAKERV